MQATDFLTFVLTKIREGTDRTIEDPMDAKEDMEISMMLSSERIRKKLHKKHAQDVKAMRESGRLPPARLYEWPPKLDPLRD